MPMPDQWTGNTPGAMADKASGLAWVAHPAADRIWPQDPTPYRSELLSDIVLIVMAFIFQPGHRLRRRIARALVNAQAVTRS
jgi:hypothetical protein